MNLYESLRRRVRTDPESTAVRIPGECDVLLADLDSTARRVSGWLRECSLEPGDRVTVYLPDVAAYIPVVFGIWHAGCVATPLNTRLSTDELVGLLDDVRPRAIVGDGSQTSTALVERTATLDAKSLYTVDGDWPDEESLPLPADSPPVTRLDDEPACIVFTSGSTGRPKGVVQTHRNVASQVDGGIDTFYLDETDVGLATVPLFHVGGFHEIVLMSLFAGGSVAVQRTWDPLEWAATVEATGATWSGLIPTMLVDVLDSEAARDYDASSLRFCIYGGSATPERLLEEFVAVTGVGRMVDNYGLTETAGMCVTYSGETSRRPGAMGTFSPVVEGKVVDLESGSVVPTGEQGELLLRGDSVTPGYWERPEANETLFNDGWLHTEDVVRIDEEGFVSYVDRADDVILSGGEKVAPSEVEAVVQEHPDVVAVSVLGTPHRRYGSTVTAVVVRTDAALTAEDVVSFCAARSDLAGYKKPRRVYFVKSLPKTGSHKVDKTRLASDLRDRYDDEWA